QFGFTPNFLVMWSRAFAVGFPIGFPAASKSTIFARNFIKATLILNT
ncbi:MAG: DUF2798 domain-containing protein, partial [Candidatus Asgardarchaeia archaeon]